MVGGVVGVGVGLGLRCRLARRENRAWGGGGGEGQDLRKAEQWSSEAAACVDVEDGCAAWAVPRR